MQELASDRRKKKKTLPGYEGLQTVKWLLKDTDDVNLGLLALLRQQIMFAQLRFHGFRATYVDLESSGKRIVTVQQTTATGTTVKCL